MARNDSNGEVIVAAAAGAVAGAGFLHEFFSRPALDARDRQILALLKNRDEWAKYAADLKAHYEAREAQLERKAEQDRIGAREAMAEAARERELRQDLMRVLQWEDDGGPRP